MSHPRPPLPPSRSHKPPSASPSPHLLLMELKHRILAALSKLSDRDTQQIAVDELDKIVLGLPPESVPVCLSCLYDTDSQQKSVARKECVKLFGTLAAVHRELLPPHLPKIVASIIRRLRDPDTSVRDACVDAMGVLSAQMFTSAAGATGAQDSGGGPGASSSTLAIFVKPLFDALSEQNKSVQTGAAMCLARLIESAKDPPLGGMARISPRICKALNNPNLLAKAALLPVIGSLSQVGALSQQHLAMLVPCVHEALESHDWATRKAAAETLGRMASNLGPTLASFKPSTLLILESCKFDKVKPVRDSVHSATQFWKNIQGPETEELGTAARTEISATETTDLASSERSIDPQTPSPTLFQTTSVSKTSIAANSSETLTDVPQKAGSDKVLTALKKRTPALTDKQPNPEFFQKLETRNSDDWQIEVAVPRSRPPSASAVHEADLEGVDDEEAHEQLFGKENRVAKTGNGQIHGSIKGAEIRMSGRRFVESHDTQNPVGLQFADTGLDGDPAKFSHGVKKSRGSSWMGVALEHKDVENVSWDAAHLTNSSSGNHVEGQVVNDRGNWSFMCRQLSQLECQQSSLLEMLQEFMGSSHETMLALEARVRSLERVVEDMTRDSVHLSGRTNAMMMGYDGGSMRSSSKYLLGADYINPKFGKCMDNHPSFAERLAASEAMINGVRGGRESNWRSSEFGPEDWDGFSYGNSRTGPPATYLPDGQVAFRRSNISATSDFLRVARDDLGVEQMVNRRGWDRGSRSIRHGEGPSARSVWQASKDEATLAAIRVAGEDGRASEVETLSAGASRQTAPESGSDSLPNKSGAQGKTPFWNLWSHAMECMHAGDMDSAYVEILISGDDMTLVRLMNKTGPVLEQLSASTVSEMLHAVGQLLQQQSFFEFSLPWIQQVADMVVNNEADCLGLSLASKKELLVNLQEAAGMDLPEGCLSSTIVQLLEQLANVWSINLLQVGSSQ